MTNDEDRMPYEYGYIGTIDPWSSLLIHKRFFNSWQDAKNHREFPLIASSKPACWTIKYDVCRDPGWMVSRNKKDAFHIATNIFAPIPVTMLFEVKMLLKYIYNNSVFDLRGFKVCGIIKVINYTDCSIFPEIYK